jgi:hypothetical protein
MYYATLTELRQYKQFATTETGDDALLTMFIKSACAFADGRLGDEFSPHVATRYFDVPAGRKLQFNDHLLALTSITNGNGDAIATNDVVLLPATVYPKYGILLKPSASIWWTPSDDGNYEQVIAVTGIWGYHTDYDDAWVSSLDAVADAGGINASVTTINVTSAAGLAADGLSPRFQAGQLIVIGSEYIDIVSISTNALTVKRGTNGSTAAAHLTAAPISIFRPMDSVKMAVIRLAAWRYAQKDANVFDMTTILGTGIKITPSAVPDDVLALLPEPSPLVFVGGL